ncbi:hypothetical protein TW95_gp0747 [Pandoravirus inopinatum]|uniref:Uncharacterized protein n=1 Tax=Pandoravirus inopinatum TaxID=1605721 RepID=A0A0B5J9D3_9VIRU|nr:hypothetical protein TW95_gp0747 [Pandoravirus inopinatum]AJF97481.1 hypothetical protein [Pandoravirus inopinatum]
MQNQVRMQTQTRMGASFVHNLLVTLKKNNVGRFDPCQRSTRPQPKIHGQPTSRWHGITCGAHNHSESAVPVNNFVSLFLPFFFLFYFVGHPLWTTHIFNAVPKIWHFTQCKLCAFLQHSFSHSETNLEWKHLAGK